MSCIKIADFHENALDILKSNIIWDSSEWWVVKGIVIASSVGSLGQSVSNKLLNYYFLSIGNIKTGYNGQWSADIEKYRFILINLTF